MWAGLCTALARAVQDGMAPGRAPPTGLLGSVVFEPRPVRFLERLLEQPQDKNTKQPVKLMNKQRETQTQHTQTTDTAGVRVALAAGIARAPLLLEQNS